MYNIINNELYFIVVFVLLCYFIERLDNNWGRRGRDGMVVEFITTYQSVPITTNIVSSNPAQARCDERSPNYIQSETIIAIRKLKSSAN
jgi:hypothetical protein